MRKIGNTEIEGFVNSAIVFTIALPIGILWFFIEPANHGFYCGDESLSYPLKNNTISNAVLCIFCIGVPIVLICSIEWLFPPSTSTNNSSKEKIRNICLTIVDHLFGVAVTVLFTITANFSIGRLR
jgi:phosphatidate phosphatase